ncbi:MAG: zinc-ribbon domain-containing protein [Lachnospiraceae bacterium]|nr:zinc-ribbon domain-containing protein [Lachnospiraceae bacterium]
MAFCPKCGAEIQDGVQFCSSCGAPISAEAVAAKESGSISIEILRRAFTVVMSKPLKLWGLSLLTVFLCGLATTLGGAVPIIGLGIGYVLSLGMSWVYLDGYRGEDVNVDQIFEGFHNFWHSLAGMGWKDIIILLWSMIPVVGPIFGIINTYAYSLVPYIIREDETRKATDVARESKARTMGYKGKMFLTDLLIALVIIACFIVMALLANIPVLGVLLDVIILIAICIILPLFCGLVRAAWYEEIMKDRQ